MFRVRTGPENPEKPWKIFEALEIPGKPWKSPGIFLLSRGKSHRTLLKKLIREMVRFVDFITSSYRNCRFSYQLKTSFCVSKHCLVLKLYTWSTLLLYSKYINY